MKRVILKGFAAALVLVATTTAINAQPQRPRNNPEQMEQVGEPGEKGARGERGAKEEKEELTPEQRATKMTEKMTENLKLTEAQAKKAYKVNLDFINKQIEAKKLQSQYKLNMLEILDDDQSIEYLDKLSAPKGKPMGMGKENPRQGGQGERGGRKMDNKRGGERQGERGGERPEGEQPRPEGKRGPRPGAPEAAAEASAE